jgi:hypothetical protein
MMMMMMMMIMMMMMMMIIIIIIIIIIMDSFTIYWIYSSPFIIRESKSREIKQTRHSGLPCRGEMRNSYKFFGSRRRKDNIKMSLN